MSQSLVEQGGVEASRVVGRAELNARAWEDGEGEGEVALLAGGDELTDVQGGGLALDGLVERVVLDDEEGLEERRRARQAAHGLNGDERSVLVLLHLELL